MTLFSELDKAFFYKRRFPGANPAKCFKKSVQKFPAYFKGIFAISYYLKTRKFATTVLLT